MSNSAVTACRLCREQKLKCSRERPACSRCVRLQLECHFPDPPNRKLLASFRRPYKRRRGEQERKTHSPAREQVPPCSAQLESPEQDPVAQSTSSPNCASIIESLPPALCSLFVEVYFSRMYHAYLLFSNSEVMQDFKRGSLPAHVVAAVFATATVFIKPESSLHRSNISLLKPLGCLKTVGRVWAQAAGREVLQVADTPSLSTVRTCEILSLYWFSAADSQRNIMFSGIAYKAANVLHLDRAYELPNISTTAQESSARPFDAELKIRCFWAAWATNCINRQHYTPNTSVNERILNLPLPADRLWLAVETQTRTANDPLPPGERETSETPSTLAELIQLLMIWAKISDFLAGCKQMPQQERLAQLFRLDERLSQTRRSLHSSLAYSKRNLYRQLIVADNINYVFIHALYYQCLLVLHASIVPQFSGLPADMALSAEFINTSTRVALTNAKRISELAADLIALDWDFSRVPPFVGYCIYASSSILVVFLYSRQQDVIDLSRKRLDTNLQALCLMMNYWTFLEKLQARIQFLFESQPFQSPIPPTQESSHADATDRAEDEAGEGHTIKLIATQSPSSLQLGEPLRDSILEYGLHLHEHDELSPVTNNSDLQSRAGESIALANRIEQAGGIQALTAGPGPGSVEPGQLRPHTNTGHQPAPSSRSREAPAGHMNPANGHGDDSGRDNAGENRLADFWAIEDEPNFFSDPASNLLLDPHEAWPFLSDDWSSDLWQIGLDTMGVPD